MACDILDWRCVFVNEIAGTVLIAGALGLLFYFIIASKMNWGFTTTVGFLFPVIMIMGLAISGFSAIFAFSTILIGFMASAMFKRIIDSR